MAVWLYGSRPDGRLLTYYYEYHFLYITGIDHVESKSIQGAALMKLTFHGGKHEPGHVGNHRLR
jgi:hypothetical protein